MGMDDNTPGFGRLEGKDSRRPPPQACSVKQPGSTKPERTVFSMKRTMMLAALLAATAISPAAAQEETWSTADKEGVIAAAMDYMDGARNVDTERVARGVHEELNKVMVRTLPQTGKQILVYNTRTTLLEAVRGIAARVVNVDKTVSVTIFDIDHDLALARAVGALWYDYLQLAKIDGQWKIVNVLWARNQLANGGGQNTDADAAAVEAVALDYVDGAFSGDTGRVAGATHPELNSVLLRQHAETGRQFLHKRGSGSLIESTRAGMDQWPEGERNIQVEIYDVSHDLAQVKVTSVATIKYLQVAKVDGVWKIVNTLWRLDPNRPRG